jgi:hypothetical protein
MEKKPAILETLYEHVEQYTTTSIELYRLKTIKKSAEVISGIASGLALTVLLSICFLVFNIGVAIFLGKMTGETYYGFFIVSGFYLLLALIVYIFRKQWIKTPIAHSIIAQTLK